MSAKIILRNVCLPVLVFLWLVKPALGDQFELAREGQAKADIVVDAKASEEIRSAARMLAETIEKISDAKLPVVDAITGDCAHIVISQTQKAALDTDGFEISFPSRNRVTISAHSEKGVIFGVFDFIENYLGVKWLPLNFGPFSPICHSRESGNPVFPELSGFPSLLRRSKTFGCEGRVGSGMTITQSTASLVERRNSLSVPCKTTRCGHIDLARKMWNVSRPSEAQIEVARANRAAYMEKGWGIMGLNGKLFSTPELGKPIQNYKRWLTTEDGNDSVLSSNVDPADIVEKNASWVPVADSPALQLNGTNVYVLVQNLFIPSSHPFSVECWIKPSALNGYIVGYNPCFFVRLSMKDSSPRLNAGVCQEGWREVFSKTAIITGDWYHICLTYDLNKLRLFINGVEEASQPAPAAGGNTRQPDENSIMFRQMVKATLTPQERCALVADSGFVAFGCTPWKIDESGGFFNGLIYQPRLYLSALSIDEVQEHYEKGEICQPINQAK